MSQEKTSTNGGNEQSTPGTERENAKLERIGRQVAETLDLKVERQEFGQQEVVYTARNTDHLSMALQGDTPAELYRGIGRMADDTRIGYENNPDLSLASPAAKEIMIKIATKIDLEIEGEQAKRTKSEKAEPELKYLLNKADIPAETLKLMSDKTPGMQIYPAREDGNYRGRIAYTDDNYLVQSVGKAGTTAVIHRRSDVELQGFMLKDRAEKHHLNSAGMQIAYKGANAKGYPVTLEKQQGGDKPVADKGAPKPAQEAKRSAAQHEKTPAAESKAKPARAPQARSAHSEIER